MIGSFLRKYGTITATALVCLALYLLAGSLYDNFFRPGVLVGFFRDNAFLGICAIGVTFVILTGGIDLSVGAMVGCSSIIIATLIGEAHWHPIPAIVIALLFGTALGAFMGALIHFYALPPFIVTLAGMFLARGLGFVVHQESLSIDHPFYESMRRIPENLLNICGLSDSAALSVSRYIPLTGLIFLAVLAVGIYIAHWTRFGRNIYAVGGSEESALLMGLPVGRTKIQVYALSGFCSALAGAVFTLYMGSGNATAGTMLELDAIAAAVIGGTLLSGGVGYVAGTLFGVLIFGIIQTAIAFDGRLSSWWTRIAIGFLLLAFILFQRLLQKVMGEKR
ncbi:MAG: sugar ABC transporter permease YjfF [Phycisphaerales bacterium]|nr:MAG: sugar ABC transporter permease YjfF [Phycisphaerales bacterium]